MAAWAEPAHPQAPQGTLSSRGPLSMAPVCRLVFVSLRQFVVCRYRRRRCRLWAGRLHTEPVRFCLIKRRLPAKPSYCYWKEAPTAHAACK